ncbi:esterase/lipase family protein [Anaerosporobacter sp.]
MKYFIKTLETIILSIIIFLIGNIYSISKIHKVPILLTVVLIILYLLININPSLYNRKLQTKRLRICGNGCDLLCAFLISVTASVVYSIIGFVGKLPIGSISSSPRLWIINTIFVILLESVIFWNGIIRVYTTSVQLGIRWRAVGLLCGFIPILNLIVLSIIIKKVSDETWFENDMILRNQKRGNDRICATKYPILLVHGVFFRDSSYLNYWGRIPKVLEENGATVYYGNHQSAASVVECAKELTDRIKQIVEETNCEKVNIIAHSKGGLDCRYAISLLGADQYVASLTTINTPHRGCEFADYLLNKISQERQDSIAKVYNNTLKKLGDTNPNFLEAVYDLTSNACQQRNEMVPDVDNVYYQSIGSKLNKALSGKFPLNFTYLFVQYFDGANDGLVGENSFQWGENYRFVTLKGNRGISHGDMIDLNRENIKNFDVREFYVELVSGLREKGL